MGGPGRLRFLLLGTGGLALLAGLTGALVLLGTAMPGGAARFGAPLRGETARRHVALPRWEVRV